MKVLGLLAAVACTSVARADPLAPSLTLRGFVATDLRAFASDVPASASERLTFAVRAAGVQVDASAWQRLRLQVLANLIDRASPVVTALADWQLAPWLTLRVGRAPFPLTQERLTPPLSLPFVGTSIVGLAVPAADTGVAVYGAVAGERLHYNLALLNGAVSGQPADVDLDTGKDVVARLFLAPLGFGVGASYGVHRGGPTGSGLPALRTYGGQLFFAYRAEPAIVADGPAWRIAPHLVLASGSVGLQVDALLASDTVGDQAVRMHAYDAIATVALTGEEVKPLAFVLPRRPVDRGGPGALLGVVGAGQIVIDDAAFPALADPMTAAAGMSVLGAGLKWYPVAGVALFVDYGHQRFRTAPGGLRRATEDTLVARLQVIL